MKAGRLAVKIHDAEYCSLLDQGDEVFCAAHIDEYGKLCTEARTCEQPMTFHEELTFKIGPPEADGHPLTLQLMLFKQQGDEEDRQLLGMGSMLLEGLEEGDKLSVKVPLVDKIGKHSGDVSATCRYFPSRCVGKSRDELGREVIDPIMVNKGPREGAREVNERSPQHSPKRMGASIHR